MRLKSLIYLIRDFKPANSQGNLLKDSIVVIAIIVLCNSIHFPLNQIRKGIYPSNF